MTILDPFRFLKVGGTLSYLIPTTWDFTPHDLPIHPCFRMIHCCVQGLTTRHSRHLVVLRKVCRFTSRELEEFNGYRIDVLNGRDDGFGLLMKMLEKALAPDAHTNVEVVKQSSNCSLKRKQKRAKRAELREQGLVGPQMALLHPRKQEAAEEIEK